MSVESFHLDCSKRKYLSAAEYVLLPIPSPMPLLFIFSSSLESKFTPISSSSSSLSFLRMIFAFLEIFGNLALIFKL
ncbi:MAG: hypothetical protein BM556_06755 [Bacteriovorax sp. MedPE-SWde]|nr:MAG: hypothetical protein BM556_06755 [Bacteriovorax sp. MedPE-SWde]